MFKEGQKKCLALREFAIPATIYASMINLTLENKKTAHQKDKTFTNFDLQTKINPSIYFNTRPTFFGNSEFYSENQKTVE